jgi:hypothetical protein
MLNNPNPLLSKPCLKTSNHTHFQMVEAVGIKNYHIEVPLNYITFLQNLIQMYQVVQKISIDPLYLTPAMSLGCFCSASLNLNHFRVLESMGLKIITSRSP